MSNSHGAIWKGRFHSLIENSSDQKPASLPKKESRYFDRAYREFRPKIADWLQLNRFRKAIRVYFQRLSPGTIQKANGSLLPIRGYFRNDAIFFTIHLGKIQRSKVVRDSFEIAKDQLSSEGTAEQLGILKTGYFWRGNYPRKTIKWAKIVIRAASDLQTRRVRGSKTINRSQILARSIKKLKALTARGAETKRS